ncbi:MULTISPECIES: pyridoxal phosphate-dependent decarboxylase family protein [unclassified Priestia]|uniref:pyridoxal phosphate-dependent decarboxylase family protein n=1 Tax=unclassified Priestia TaxID=2800374 RepID=UPI00366EF0D4
MMMKIGVLPTDSFIDPNGKNVKEVKILIDAVINLVVDYASNSGDHPPLSPECKKKLFNEFSSDGISTEELLLQLETILKHSMNPLTPRYMGHMDSIPTLISCLSEFVTTTLNNNMLSLEMSPVFSKMEVQVLQQLTQMFGLGPNAGGVITSGGSLANLQALAVARNSILQVKENGLTSLTKQPVILVSEASHTSLHKAAMLLGLGTSSVIPVKSNPNSQMDTKDLETKITTLIQEGKQPFAVVATAGTTVTGSIDPLLTISEITTKYGIWFHVDAAYGGALVFSKKHRELLSGIEQADSITFNPQKWMYVAKTCAMVLFKNHHLLETDFRISAPYMNETDFTNLGEISVQGTRHADILKLYLSLQHIGLKGYEDLINQGFTLIEEFTREVKKRSYLELSGESVTNICCFRLLLNEYGQKHQDQLNLKLQQYLLKGQQVFLSLPAYRGKRWLRAVLLNPFISSSTIQQVFKKIDDFYIEHCKEHPLLK